MVLQLTVCFHQALSSVQTGKFLAQVFLHQKTCARKRVQVTRSHYASFLFEKVVIRFAKMRSPVNRPISGWVSRQKLAWNRTCSIPASFWRQFLAPEKWRQKPRSHRQVFWRKKLAPETCQSERIFMSVIAMCALCLRWLLTANLHMLLLLGVLGVFLRKWCLALQHSLERKMLGISWIVSGR